MTAIVLLSDLHVNSTTALSLPTVMKDDGRTERYSKPQKFIYDSWVKTIQRIEEISKSEDVITIFCGDIADMKCKYKSFQTITNNPTFIKNHTIELIEPVCNISNAVYFIRGTQAHTGESSYIEEDIASDFSNTVPNIELNAMSWYYLKLKVDNIKFDISHSTNMSGIPWMKHNAVLQLASKILFDYSNRGEELPDLVIRGHVHRGSDSYDAFRVRAITLRGFTFADEYINTFSLGNIGEIGATIIHTKKNKKYEVEKLNYDLPRTKWQTLPKF